jgi:hypothetical protein
MLRNEASLVHFFRRQILSGLLLSLVAVPGDPGEARARKKSGPRASRSRGGRASGGGGAAYYANCSAARAAGAAPVRSSDPGYSRKLDRDGDGIGCE